MAGLVLRSMFAATAALPIALAWHFGAMPARSSTAVPTPKMGVAADADADLSRLGARKSRIRVASLDMDFAPEPAAHAAPTVAAAKGSSFVERFNSMFAEPLASFDARFGAKTEREGAPRLDPVQRDSRSAAAPDRDSAARPESAPKRRNVRLAMVTPADSAAALTGPVPLPLPDPRSEASPDLTARTAIYDISARIVYLPNGERLEAHSGLGAHMDDPRSVAVKMKGVTPPNVYALSLRERLFHGVQALRLTPVDRDKTFGRDGLLAHSYMLGPSGQSNGCVSISNYDKFLNAFLNGEIERLVVVEHLADPPPANSGAAWLTERLKALFGAS